ncbi:unnamed protein product, partial [Ixodes pacificus]
PALSRPWPSFSGTVPPAVPAAGSRGTGRQPEDQDRGDVDCADGEPAAAHLLECPSMEAAVASGRRHPSGQGAIPLPGLHRQRDELRCPGGRRPTRRQRALLRRVRGPRGARAAARAFPQSLRAEDPGGGGRARSCAPGPRVCGEAGGGHA